VWYFIHVRWWMIKINKRKKITKSWIIMYNLVLLIYIFNIIDYIYYLPFLCFFIRDVYEWKDKFGIILFYTIKYSEVYKSYNYSNRKKSQPIWICNLILLFFFLYSTIVDSEIYFLQYKHLKKIITYMFLLKKEYYWNHRKKTWE